MSGSAGRILGRLALFSKVFSPPLPTFLDLVKIRHHELLLLNALAQRADRGPLKQRHDRKLDLQGLLNSVNHSETDQRIAAQIEKIVMDAELVDAKRLLPDLQNRVLKFTSWRHIRGCKGRPGMENMCSSIFFVAWRGARASFSPELYSQRQVAGRNDYPAWRRTSNNTPKCLSAFFCVQCMFLQARVISSVNSLIVASEPRVPICADPAGIACNCHGLGEGIHKNARSRISNGT